MDFNALAVECAPWVAPQTLAAIVRTESQFRPLAIGINGGAKLTRQPATKEEAVVTAKWLIANKYNIDIGLGQVNSANLAKTGLSVENAFDPCHNLAAAGMILTWNYQSASKRIPNEQAALHAAISAYNTGSFTRGFSNGYVRKVVNNSNLAHMAGNNAKTTISLPTAPITVIPTALPEQTTVANSAAKKRSAVKKLAAARMIGNSKLASATEPPADPGIMVYAD